jgi:signal transduction histidine kinase
MPLAGPQGPGGIDRALLARIAGDWIWRTDARNRIVAVDGRLAELTGIDPATLVGRARTDLADVRQDAPGWAAHLAEIAARRPFRGFRSSIDTPAGPRRISETGEPCFEADGSFAGYLIAVTDLTTDEERHRAAATLHAMTLEAIEALKEGFALYDQEGRLAHANGRLAERAPRLATALEPGSLYGALVAARAAAGEIDLDGASVADWIAARDARLAQGEVLVDERLVGDRVLAETELRTRAGGRVLLVADVTEARRDRAELENLARNLAAARDAAEAANRAKSEFLATISHELRTPLNVVIGFSQLVADNADAVNADYAREILSSGRGLLGIINDLIELSNAEAGRLALVREPESPAELLDAVAEAHRAAAAARDVAIAVEADPALPRVDVDARRLRRALDHLIENAVRFSPAKGIVRLGATPQPDGALALWVADQGAGMAPADISRALERFGKVDASLGRHHDGAGIGLTLARALIALHGGTLELESALGSGTVARLLVPRADVMAAEMMRGKDGTDAGGGHAGP